MKATMKVLGVTLGHDTSFALIVDGKIAGIVEAERYFRSKRYKLSAIHLSEGKQLSGYQYTCLEDLSLFLTLIDREWGNAFDYLAVQNQGRSEEYHNFL